MPKTRSTPDIPVPLAGREIAASGGPFRQFCVTLDDGSRHYITFQEIRIHGYEPTPSRPTNAQINQTIGILAGSRAFG